jgi:hypothetical protein
MCCVDAAGQPVAVDDCGVCGGVHHCGALVELTVELTVSVAVSSDTSSLVRITEALAVVLSLPSSAVSDVALSNGSVNTSRRLRPQDRERRQLVSVVLHYTLCRRILTTTCDSLRCVRSRPSLAMRRC